MVLGAILLALGASPGVDAFSAPLRGVPLPGGDQLSGAPLRVGVAVVTFDRPGYLERCLENIATQTYPKAETVSLVVDDTPGDGARLALEESTGLAIACSRYVHLDERRSIGYKRGLAARLAVECGCDVIVTWDDDDVYGSDRLDLQVGPIARGEADATVATRVGRDISEVISLFKRSFRRSFREMITHSSKSRSKRPRDLAELVERAPSFGRAVQTPTRRSTGVEFHATQVATPVAWRWEDGVDSGGDSMTWGSAFPALLHAVDSDCGLGTEIVDEAIASLAYRADFYGPADYPDSSYDEDRAFLLNLKARGARVLRLPPSRPSYVHVKHEAAAARGPLTLIHANGLGALNSPVAALASVACATAALRSLLPHPT